MKWFFLFCYLFFAYGCSLIVTNGVGPKNIFIRLRAWAENVGPNFGLLFRCMMCFPCNLGIVFSLLNWFLIPVSITPFNMIFADYHSIWYLSILAAIMDGCLTSGICHIIYNIEDYIDKSTPIYEDEVPHYKIDNDGE